MQLLCSHVISDRNEWNHQQFEMFTHFKISALMLCKRRRKRKRNHQNNGKNCIETLREQQKPQPKKNVIVLEFDGVNSNNIECVFVHRKQFTIQISQPFSDH